MSQPTQKRMGGHADATPAALPAWGALRYNVFRFLWIATVVSNVGSWMFSAASGWLMTNLDARPWWYRWFR